METVIDPPVMPGQAKYREYAEEEPSFVHARPAGERRRSRRSHREPIEPPPQQPSSANAPVGAWTVIETVARWWYWLLLAGIAGMLMGYFFGKQFFETGYIASVEI